MKKFEKEWHARFERFARSYDEEHLISGWSYSGLHIRLSLFEESLMEQHLPPGSHVLDLGCGGGTYVRYLGNRGYRATGMDYSLSSLCRARNADSRMIGWYLGGEAYNLPFHDESFDLVVLIGVLQALDNPERAIEEIYRVLKPDGLIIVEFLNGYELFAFVKTLFNRIMGRSWRVRTYSPFYVQSLFGKGGFTFIKRIGVYLPPRNLPSFGRILNFRGTRFFLEEIPGISLIGAHAFLVVGKKRP